MGYVVLLFNIYVSYGNCVRFIRQVRTGSTARFRTISADQAGWMAH